MASVTHSTTANAKIARHALALDGQGDQLSVAFQLGRGREYDQSMTGKALKKKSGWHELMLTVAFAALLLLIVVLIGPKRARI